MVMAALGLSRVKKAPGDTDSPGTKLTSPMPSMRGCGSRDCKVVFRVGPRQCAAIALTEDGKVWAGSTRPTKGPAELAAVQGCQKRTLVQCRLRDAACNR